MINESDYQAYCGSLKVKEAKVKDLYSMLDQLYTFSSDKSKDDILIDIKHAYMKDKILTREEYDLIKYYVEHGYVK